MAAGRDSPGEFTGTLSPNIGALLIRIGLLQRILKKGPIRVTIRGIMGSNIGALKIRMVFWDHYTITITSQGTPPK